MSFEIAVEPEPLQIVRHPCDRAVHVDRTSVVDSSAARSTASYRREDTPQPVVHARTVIGVAGDQLPIDVVLERVREQHRESHRVGAPSLDGGGISSTMLPFDFDIEPPP